MPGISGRPSALPFFAKQKAIIIAPPFYRKTAPLRKGSFGGNGVPRDEQSESWGFPAPLCELFPVTLRSTDSLREPSHCREKCGKNLYNQFLLIIV